MKEAGFIPKTVDFRRTEAGEPGKKILRETQEMSFGFCLFMEGVPNIV